MARKISALIGALIGVALVLATVTVYTQSAFAFRSNPGCGDVLPCPPGGGNGVLGGGPQTAHGLATACSNTTVEQHNPNCSGTRPSGVVANSGNQ